MMPSPLRRAAALLVLGLGCAPPPAERPAGGGAPAAAPHARAATSADGRLQEALARAPQLNRPAAELLVERSSRRGGIWVDPADASLIEADRGFSRLEPADLSELGALFREAYGTLSPVDRVLVEGYVERVRRGDTNEGDERSRGLMAQAVLSLPEARRARLQALVEAAIRAGLDSERRTALARQSTPVPLPPVTRAPGWARRGAGDGSLHRPAGERAEPDGDSEDARLRALGASYKERLVSLDGDVRFAERAVESARASVDRARETPLNKRPLGDPDVVAAEQRLSDAREALQRARNAVDDLHTRIRRERIPYSYVQ